MIGTLIQVDLEELIQQQAWDELRRAVAGLTDQDVAELLIDLPPEDEGIIFRLLPRDRAAEVFSYLPVDRQEELIKSLSLDQTRDLLNAMSPDDRVNLLDELPAAVTTRLLDSLSPEALKATRRLLGYPPDTAGHFMTPNYVALRADMTVTEAFEHIRRSPRTTETLVVLYVVDERGVVLRDLRLATLVRAEPTARVGDIVDRPLVTLPARTDREEVVRAFEKYDRFALPVTDEQGHMLGIITVDDVLDVARMEATEDLHKLGGVQAVETSYLQTGFFTMLRKRGGWLSVLFLGEMLTASAMGFFEGEIERAVVLALFLPLIISSGGNSGSQAATLVIRALALAELKLADWWRVAYREIGLGLAMGLALGAIGFLRIIGADALGWADYGPHTVRIGLTIWASVLGVVALGTVTGSTFPLLLRAARLDPATSSAPFIATLVDVTGLVIYFSIAALMLRGVVM